MPDQIRPDGNVAPPTACDAFPPLTRREFQGFHDVILAETGIHLTDQKRELLVARLSRRVRLLGLRTFGEYLAIVASDSRERREMVDRILTNETTFFREPLQFDFLEKTIAPGWLEQARNGRRERRIRVWSAGCSSGQEPVSIAMVLLTVLPGWEIDILATDLSHRVLAQASEGMWPVEKAAEIPERFLKTFMLRGVRSQKGTMKCNKVIAAAIDYRSLGLNMPIPEIGKFDAIFCRNVLIYFDPDARREAIDRIINRLSPGGFLFLGHSESLVNGKRCVRTVAPTIYARGNDAQPGAGDTRA